MFLLLLELFLLFRRVFAFLGGRTSRRIKLSCVFIRVLLGSYLAADLGLGPLGIGTPGVCFGRCPCRLLLQLRNVLPVHRVRGHVGPRLLLVDLCNLHRGDQVVFA